jgi:LysM repeat protein
MKSYKIVLLCLLSGFVFSQTKTHKVITKETVYSIANLYHVVAEDLIQANPIISEKGLQIGQTIIIPTIKTIDNTTKNDTIYHEVLAKETKYGIATKYGITVETLEANNPAIKDNLMVGSKLFIKAISPEKKPIAVVNKTITATKIIQPKTDISYQSYTVKAKETLYGLTKMFQMSQEELVALNPALTQGLTEGMVLKIPSSIVISKETVLPPSSVSVKETVQPVQTILTVKKTAEKKKLALLLPFNLARIEADTINNINERLKKDKFLNLTLDFYSGALMAIDSVKQLGVQVDVAVFDSEETKNSSAILNLIRDKKIEESSVIIGPFYQNNLEKAAFLMKDKPVVLLSPLSKEVNDSIKNIVQTVPTTTVLRAALFNYIKSKEGNCLAIVDKKKVEVSKYITDNQKQVNQDFLDSKGIFLLDKFKKSLFKDRMNFVVLESENTVLINSVLKNMLALLPTYKLQLVILEPNQTFDTDEVNFESLAKLKLLYPSISNENQAIAAQIFEKEYKEKNKIAPNYAATRGFDLTFDTLMRLSQDKSYLETIESIATEQVDSKFEFYKNEKSVYSNKGVYLLYYDTDLTIKQAN